MTTHDNPNDNPLTSVTDWKCWTMTTMTTYDMLSLEDYACAHVLGPL
jgi:hypothetical protein